MGVQGLTNVTARMCLRIVVKDLERELAVSGLVVIGIKLNIVHLHVHMYLLVEVLSFAAVPLIYCYFQGQRLLGDLSHAILIKVPVN